MSKCRAWCDFQEYACRVRLTASCHPTRLLLLQRYKRVLDELQSGRHPILEPVFRRSLEGRHGEGEYELCVSMLQLS